MRHSLKEISDGIERGNPRAIARGISVVENDFPEAHAWRFRHRFTQRELRRFSYFLMRQRPRAWRIGVTGSSAAGKSTLINHCAGTFLQKGLRVAVIAIDPTGVRGALFGDRIRIGSHAGNPNFYLRSMATRGDTRGLVRNLDLILRLLDAARFDLIIVETPGARQNDTAIREHAETLLVVMAPQGDAVTFMKGGLTEIADVFAVNQVDRYREHDVRRVTGALREEVAARGRVAWKPPVVETVATENRGIPELLDALEAHRAFLVSRY